MRVLSLLALLLLAPAVRAAAPTRSFAVQGDRFVLDGKPFVIHSGELHYPRIPREYWADRLATMKKMGFNAVSTYVFWNAHEAKPGVYDFSGDKDVAEFVREAQKAGLYVILRPGPYVCAEWENGGFPAWLLKDQPDGTRIKVRSSDPKFLAAVGRWFTRLGAELAPLQYARGGPIIMVQVENEYGGFATDVQQASGKGQVFTVRKDLYDPAYMKAIRDLDLAAGFTSSVLFTADPPYGVGVGSIPGVLAAVNGPAGQAQAAVDALRKQRPGAPAYVAELWTGWFDVDGRRHSTTSADLIASDIPKLQRGSDSFSAYMVEGGDNFGGMNGANAMGKARVNITQEYDYDALLGDDGRLTAKGRKVCAALTDPSRCAQLTHSRARPAQRIPPFSPSGYRSLWTVLPKPQTSPDPKPMEDFGQAEGFILYRTTVHRPARGPAKAVLSVPGVNDYAVVYLKGARDPVPRKVGTLNLNERDYRTSLFLEVAESSEQLYILVENSGRINFGPEMRDEQKGIVGTVSFAGEALRDWKIYPLPMSAPEKMTFGSAPCAKDEPCFYAAGFDAKGGADTYLDIRRTSRLVRGAFWINGRLLGRFSDADPQGTFFVDAGRLNAGRNAAVVFDLGGEASWTVSGLTQEIFNK